MKATQAQSKHESSNHRARRGVEQPHLGLDEGALKQVYKLLNTTLSNLYLLTTKTKKMHWDVVGPQFMTLHKLWDEQYEQMAVSSDEVAERIRTLGGYPVATLQGFLENTELKESPGQIPYATDAVEILLGDHETIVRSLRQAIGKCEDTDVGTADFLTGLLQDHEKMAWMLRSFLQGEAIHPRDVKTPRDGEAH